MLHALIAKYKELRTFFLFRQDFYVPEISVLVSMEETLGLADVYDDDTDSDVDLQDYESEWQAVDPSDFTKK